MSKNKLIWIFGLILTALLVMPIAYAQIVPSGSKIYFVLINAAIIFVVLFMLQAFLIRKQTDKETTSVWVIMIFASLLLAYFFGQNGFLWQGPLARFFSIFVLVNAVIIGAVLYFVLGFLLKDKVPKSPEGIGGYGILIFLVALVFAVQIGNQWIWSQPTIKELVNFFFGNEGILTTNKNRIFIFIGSAALLTWFFNSVALGKENHKINYILAIVFAAHMATGPDPYTMDNVKTLLLIVGTWVLGSNLSEKFTGKWKIAGYVIAFALVYWATSIVETAVTPEGKAVVAERGWISAIFSTLGGNKFWIFLFIAVLILFFIIFRGENRAIVNEIRERYARVIWNKLKDSASQGLLNWIFFWVKWPKRETPKDMLHPIFLENLYMFHALTSYMKRVFIMFSKWGQVREAKEKTVKAYEGIKKHGDEVLLVNELKAFRVGGRIAKRDEKEALTEETKVIEGGWFGANRELMNLINKIMNYLERYTELSIKHGTKAPPEMMLSGNDPLWLQLAEEAGNLYTALGTVLAKIQGYSEATKERLEDYGHHNVVKAWRYLVFDQDNPTGKKWPHTYLFVLPGAEILDGNGKPAGKSTELTEVNMFGELLEDIYKNIDQFAKDPLDRYMKPRRVKHTKDIINYQDPREMFDFIDNEWQGFILDIRFGEYHPYSRAARDYINKMVYKKEFYDDSKIIADLPSEKGLGMPAFDREALKNPGQMIYWGRKSYKDAHSQIKKTDPANPYPTLSSVGMSRYLNELVIKDMADKQEALKSLNLFLGDTGEWSTSTKEAYKAIGLLWLDQQKNG